MLYGIYAAVYILGFPLVLVGIDQLHKYWFITRKTAKKPARSVPKDLPKRWMPRILSHIRFTMADKRDLTVGKKTYNVKRLAVYWALYVIGLVLAVATPVFTSGIILGFIFWVASSIFGVKSAKKFLEMRSRVTRRLAEIAVKALGQERAAIDNPDAYLKVLEWRELRYPQKVEFEVPTSFDEMGQAGFLRMVNQVFGQQTTFVSADTEDEEGNITPGWDYENGKVVIVAMPPLPTIAKWEARYIEDPGIAWSFFPLALGVEGGVRMANPETGEPEYVLGFDVSGLQAKAAAKAGYRLGNEITTSPMALIAGGTGGGKAQSLDTMVKVRRPICHDDL